MKDVTIVVGGRRFFGSHRVSKLCFTPTRSSSFPATKSTTSPTVVAPGLMVAATDSRHMLPIADHVYRFSPVRVTDSDLSRFHGTNERLSVEGKLLGNPRGIGSLGSVGVRQGVVKANTLKYAEGRRGGFDPVP